MAAEHRAQDAALGESPFVQWLLIGLAVLLLCGLVLLPLLVVLVEALGQGVAAYLAAVDEPDTRAAIRLTLLVAAIAVPVNALLGLATAWAVTKFEFAGKRLLLAFIDLPLAVSPVVAGFVLVLLFGAHGWFGAWLQEQGVQVLFATPGIILATLFVTFPFVAAN